MFLVLEDDGCVHVYESPAAAVAAIEALDVEECVRAAFDGRAQRYVIKWLEPNKHSRSLWMFETCENGRYEFVPEGHKDVAGLRRMLETAREVLPEGSEKAVRSVLAGLQDRRPGAE